MDNEDFGVNGASQDVYTKVGAKKQIPDSFLRGAQKSGIIPGKQGVILLNVLISNVPLPRQGGISRRVMGKWYTVSPLKLMSSVKSVFFRRRSPSTVPYWSKNRCTLSKRSGDNRFLSCVSTLPAVGVSCTLNVRFIDWVGRFIRYD